MTPSIRTTGNARPFDHTPGYQNTSRFSSRWEQRQSPREKLAWCALFITITSAAIAAHYGAFL